MTLHSCHNGNNIDEYIKELEFIVEQLRNKKPISKWLLKSFFEVIVLTIILERKDFYSESDKQGISEFSIKFKTVSRTVYKTLKCEEAPKILCIHLNKTLESDVYGGGFNPKMRLDQRLIFNNTSSNEQPASGKNSSYINSI